LKIVKNIKDAVLLGWGMGQADFGKLELDKKNHGGN